MMDPIYLLLSVGERNDGKKCCKFQSNICNGFDKKVNWYKKRNQNFKSKKGRNSYKILDRVISSCLLMEVMMLNKCCRFQSNICNGFDKKVNLVQKT